MTTPAWIGLGSNLGDRQSILDAAIAALANASGVVVRAVSSSHETQPVGGPPGQGPFLNAAAHLETTLDPWQLLATLQEVENQAGRVRTVRWGERTLDLDILIFGTQFLDERNLKLPHPRLAFRRFVLAPLAEIAPEVVDPMTEQTIAHLLANLDRKPRLLAIQGSEGQRKSTVFGRLVEELPGFGIASDDLWGLARREARWDLEPFDLLERKGEALNAERWAIETLRVPWIVTDYCLTLDLLHASTPAWHAANSRSERGVPVPNFEDGMIRVRSAAKAALKPTLILNLPGEAESKRKPSPLKIPQLWPDSDKPDDIIAEVLATCRAIEGV